MIRNYQRAGGATVDLVPIYNSISQLQNEVNSLITLTHLSTLSSISTGITAFTGSIQSISGSVNMLISADEQHESSIRDNVSAINSLSSSVMDINSIISTLTAGGGGGGGGGKTLTNPTESGHLFTDAVLYSGPNISSKGYDTTPNANTYMKGVTWIDAPNTAAPSGYSTKPVALNNCLVYGDLSFSAVNSLSLSNVTAQNVTISSCLHYTLVGGTYNDIYAKYGLCHASSVNAFSFKSPDCWWGGFERCSMSEVSVRYSSTLTEYVNNYILYLNSNTFNKLNASMLRFGVTGNDIRTANLYMDYDLMQNSMFTSAGYFKDNTINELSIFNNDHGTGNTTNKAISLNGLYLINNILRQMVYDLYSPFTVSRNIIGTLDNTLGVSLSAVGNNIQEWDCEVSPYSAQLYESVSGRSFALIQSNTVGKMNFTHGLNDESFSTDSDSSATMFGFNQLSIYVLNNSVDYVTFDVLNPLTMGFKGHLYSAHINLANDITFAATESVGTINMVKNERFVTGACDADIRGFRAHSMGMTNVYPRFVNVPSVDVLNMYIDGPLSTNYTLALLTANSVNIKNFASMSVGSSWIGMSQCSIEYLDYEQLNTNRIRATYNTIGYWSITGGNLVGYSCDINNMNLNINDAAMSNNTLICLGGTARNITLENNSLTLGGFYYSVSGGKGNSVVRLNSGIVV